jgi:hypothetical protein
MNDKLFGVMFILSPCETCFQASGAIFILSPARLAFRRPGLYYHPARLAFRRPGLITCHDKLKIIMESDFVTYDTRCLSLNMLPFLLCQFSSVTCCSGTYSVYTDYYACFPSWAAYPYGVNRSLFDQVGRDAHDNGS